MARESSFFKDERERFLDKEWPEVAATIERLGLDASCNYSTQIKKDRRHREHEND